MRTVSPARIAGLFFSVCLSPLPVRFRLHPLGTPRWPQAPPLRSVLPSFRTSWLPIMPPQAVPGSPERPLSYSGRFLGGVLLAWALGAVLAYIGFRLGGEPFALLSEATLRSAGGILQVFGIWSVAEGIGAIRRALGLPSVRAAIYADAKERVGRAIRAVSRLMGRRRNVRVSVHDVASAGGLGSVTGRGYGTVGGDASVEDRVKILEALVGNLQTEVGTLTGQVRQEVEDRKSADEAERQERTGADQELRSLLENVTAGGVFLELVGVLWLFLGVILTTWPQGIATIAGILAR